VDNRLFIVSGNVGLEVRAVDVNAIANGFNHSFAYRYIPSFTLDRNTPNNIFIGARIEWKLLNEGFRVNRYKLDSGSSVDIYEISSAPPRPYLNESPYFFVLQVLARQFARIGKVVFTDTVSFVDNDGSAIVLMGYPHTGKSTLTAIALDKGYTPLTTENTIIELRGGQGYIVGGTSILVYDPVIRDLYGVNIPIHEKTKHGYHVVDLDKVIPERRRILNKGIPIKEIYILHCSYSSVGAEYKPIKGRKIVKTLWYFATALIKGIDYYEPSPLDLSIDEKTINRVAETVSKLSRIYSKKIYEVFGRHDEVFKLITYKH